MKQRWRVQAFFQAMAKERGTSEKGERGWGAVRGGGNCERAARGWFASTVDGSEIPRPTTWEPCK